MQKITNLRINKSLFLGKKHTLDSRLKISVKKYVLIKIINIETGEKKVF